MENLSIKLLSPHLSNPCQGVEPLPDGTLRIVLVVDCNLDLRGDGAPGSPLAEAIDEVRDLITNYPFDSATIRQLIPEPKVGLQK